MNRKDVNVKQIHLKPISDPPLTSKPPDWSVEDPALPRHVVARRGSRWLSVDPLSNKYPGWSAYNYAADNPLALVDPDGRILKFAPGSTRQFEHNFAEAQAYLQEHGVAGNIKEIERSNTTYYIAQAGVGAFRQGLKTVFWSPYAAAKFNNHTRVSPSIVLAHEFAHASDFDELGAKKFIKYRKTSTGIPGTPLEEQRAIAAEIRAARATGEIGPNQITRRSHDDATYYPSSGPTSRTYDKKNKYKVGPVIVEPGQTVTPNK